ncbi:uncharacterized protein LOC127764390 [Oryza glaberrima]|uniref:Uncharacterized protein n=2 Tax=Oryza TaxID=4527 RepID=A0A0D3F043_9ORYZ|nr:uncharacterized protein LOC127764390 [Oryza glaberrima]
MAARCRGEEAKLDCDFVARSTMAAMRRLAAASLTPPRIPRLLRFRPPYRAPPAFLTWSTPHRRPRPHAADPTPIYLPAIEKIEKMKTVSSLTKDALKVLQEAGDKAKTHLRIMHDQYIEEVPIMEGLMQNGWLHFVCYIVPVSLPSFVLVVGTRVVNIINERSHSHLEEGIKIPFQDLENK